jgi:hypothetical protein
MPYPAVSEINTPALRITEMFFQRCVTPLLAGEKIPTDGLERLPETTALSVSPKSKGRVWMAQDAHISLSKKTEDSNSLEGCSVYWHAIAAKGRFMDSQYVIAEFNRWAERQIELGNFVEIAKCSVPNVKYLFTIESRIERDVPVRIVISTIEKLDFVFMLAAEIAASEPPKPCT